MLKEALHLDGSNWLCIDCIWERKQTCHLLVGLMLKIKIEDLENILKNEQKRNKNYSRSFNILLIHSKFGHFWGLPFKL